MTVYEKKKKRRNVFVTVMIVLVIIILILFCMRCTPKEDASVSEFEQKVNEITQIDYSGRQEEVDTLVEEGKMNVNYSPQAVFEGQKSVLFNVKNIKNNHAPILFEILDENGACIYESKQILQGYELNCIELQKKLSEGMHECKIRIGYAEAGNVSSSFPLLIEVR